MRTVTVTVALPLLLLAPRALEAQSAAAPAASATAAPAAAAADVSRLAWLTGCWELRTATRVTQESWIAPAGGLMLGTSRTVVRDVAREFEFLRIESRGGVATYVAQPNGGAATPFGATTVSDSAVTFENPQHDFPKRIMYRRVGADSLVARIEGPQGGQVRGIDFRMRRIGCG
jgi:hypothetical protein